MKSNSLHDEYILKSSALATTMSSTPNTSSYSSSPSSSSFLLSSSRLSTSSSSSSSSFLTSCCNPTTSNRKSMSSSDSFDYYYYNQSNLDYNLTAASAAAAASVNKSLTNLPFNNDQMTYQQNHHNSDISKVNNLPYISHSLTRSLSRTYQIRAWLWVCDFSKKLKFCDLSKHLQHTYFYFLSLSSLSREINNVFLKINISLFNKSKRRTRDN